MGLFFKYYLGQKCVDFVLVSKDFSFGPARVTWRAFFGWEVRLWYLKDFVVN